MRLHVHIFLYLTDFYKSCICSTFSSFFLITVKVLDVIQGVSRFGWALHTGILFSQSLYKESGKLFVSFKMFIPSINLIFSLLFENLSHKI